MNCDQLLEFRDGAALIDTFSRDRYALSKRFRPAGRDESGSGIHQNDIASGPSRAFQHFESDFAIRLFVRAFQIRGVCERYAEVFRSQRMFANSATADLENTRLAVVVISSSPSSPCTTNPRCSPSEASASAISSAARKEGAPTN